MSLLPKQKMGSRQMSRTRTNEVRHYCGPHLMGPQFLRYHFKYSQATSIPTVTLEWYCRRQFMRAHPITETFSAKTSTTRENESFPEHRFCSIWDSGPLRFRTSHRARSHAMWPAASILAQLASGLSFAALLDSADSRRNF